MEHTDNSLTRILIFESHDLIRLGLRAFLDDYPVFEIVGEYDHFDGILTKVAELEPDVILFDLMINNGNSLRHIPRLLGISPKIRILAFSSNQDQETLIEALQRGVSGIFGKHQSCQLLLKAITTVSSGEFWVDRQIAHTILLSHSNKLTVSLETPNLKNQRTLSKREYGVACLTAKGLTAKKISERLAISEKTVRNQLTAIYDKLGINGHVELCLKAEELGFCRQNDQACVWDICPNNSRTNDPKKFR